MFEDFNDSLDRAEFVLQVWETGKGVVDWLLERYEFRLLDMVSKDSLPYSVSDSRESGVSSGEVFSGICIIIDSDAKRPGVGAG